MEDLEEGMHVEKDEAMHALRTALSTIFTRSIITVTHAACTMNYATTILCSLFLALGPTTFAQDGSLDNSFGGDGMATSAVQYPNSPDESAAALRPDGKVVVVGTLTNASYFAFGAVGFNADGSLDTDFGTNGRVVTNVGSSNAYVYAVAVQLDGKIIMAGGAFDGNNGLFALSRYNSDGTLDTSFDEDGKVTTPFDPVGVARIQTLALQSDGKILAGGFSEANLDMAFAMARFNPDGTLDTEFGLDGKLTTDFSTGYEIVNSIAVQPDGKIVALGQVRNSSTYDIALARYNTDGTPDDSFGTDGKLTTDVAQNSDFGDSVALQADGKIVVAGTSFTPIGTHIHLHRYNPDGSLDDGFGVNGSLRIIVGVLSFGRALSIQPDGKLLVAGYSRGPGQADFDFTLVRYTTEGTPDNSFGSGGIVVTGVGENDEANSMALQPDGKVIVAGLSDVNGLLSFAVVRYLSGLDVGILDLSVAHTVPLIYPNPIGMHATLEYTLQHAERVSIELLDIQGRKVHTFIEGQDQASGHHQHTIELPEAFPSGTYHLAISSAKGRIMVQVVK
jgi:uncharacterized delta-60 repeat protein